MLKKIKNLRKKMNTDKYCIVLLIAIITTLLFQQGGFIPQFGTEGTEGTETATTTMTDTTTTTPITTTTTPVAPTVYTISFAFDWGSSIADGDKVWMEFAIYNLHEIDSANKLDQATLAAGYGDTNDWVDGSWGATFAEGQSFSIAMESFGGYYNFPPDTEYHDVSVGPWSHVFTFHSYIYGFSIILTGSLMVTWTIV